MVMAYTHINSKGETYYLHEFDAALKGGTYVRHFFAKAISPKGRPINAVPTDRVVVENPVTGLPCLKKA